MSRSATSLSGMALLGLRALGCGVVLLLPVALPPASAAGESSAFIRKHKALVLAARTYFDSRVDLWDGRRAFKTELKRLAAGGDQVLHDPTRLRWVVAQSRTFESSLTSRMWRREGRTARLRRFGRLKSFERDGRELSFSVPRTYPTDRRLAAYPRPDPYPLLLALHEPRDADGDRPAGVNALARRFPYGRFVRLYENWLLLAPAAGSERFAGLGGRAHTHLVTKPFRRFWRSYHVDFDRVILDGYQAALDIAAAMPYFFAGIVVRGGALPAERARSSITNFAPIPVFVVDNKELATALRSRGHSDVTSGEDCDLLEWLQARRRRMPRRYEWDAPTPDKFGSYWVNLDTVDPMAAQRRVTAEVVDTRAAPNTIRITAHGVREISLFLDDDIVDLDRPVRVLINGHLVHDASVAKSGIGRDLKALFNRRPFEVRESMYFGWLRPVWLERLRVQPR